MRTRLHQLFGQTLPWLLKPSRSVVVCLSGWLLTLPLTWQHPWLSFLGCTAIWALTFSLYIEAPLLQYFPLPPLTVLLLGLCLRWGLGPLLLSLGGSGGDSLVEVWIQYGPPAQLLWLCFTSILILLALPQKAVVLHFVGSQQRSNWLIEATQNSRFRRQLSLLAFFFSLYMAVYIVLSVGSGAFDRQFDVYEKWSQQLWRLDSPVAAFSRLRDIWFLLFPLWWRLLGRRWRLILSIELLSYMASALLSGSRGLLFYPTILLVFGLWFVVIDTRRVRILLLSTLLMLSLLSPVITVARESNGFQSASGLHERISSFAISLLDPEPLIDKARWLGRDLYACHDPFLFVPQNTNIPLAGAQGLEGLKYLWLPKHIFPERPIIFDGHLIAKKTPIWSHPLLVF